MNYKSNQSPTQRDDKGSSDLQVQIARLSTPITKFTSGMPIGPFVYLSSAKNSMSSTARQGRTTRKSSAGKTVYSYRLDNQYASLNTP